MSGLYQDLPVAALLAPHVRRATRFHETRASHRLEPPSGHLTLIAVSGDPVILSHVGRTRRYHGFLVGGAIGVSAACGADNRGVEVQLRPWAAAHLFGIDIDTAMHGVVDLGAWGLNPARLLDWVGARLGSVAASPVFDAWRALERGGEDRSIGALVERSGWSHRHFTRRFELETGLTPKRAARLLRLTRVCEGLRTDPRIALAGLAAEAGFSDQAHLTRETLRMTGETPGGLRRRRLGDLDGFGSKIFNTGGGVGR